MVNLKISGRVQGVFFRANTKEVADKLGINGFVKNENDGSVTVVAVGPKDKLGEFVSWCHDGPDTAHVDNVEDVWSDEDKQFDGFEIRY